MRKTAGRPRFHAAPQSRTRARRWPSGSPLPQSGYRRPYRDVGRSRRFGRACWPTRRRAFLRSLVGPTFQRARFIAGVRRCGLRLRGLLRFLIAAPDNPPSNGVDGGRFCGEPAIEAECTIDPDAADADAQIPADVTVVAAAMVAMSMARLRAIEHPHRPATATATDQSGQQGPTATCRLPLSPALHVGVLRDQSLIRFVLFPADVPGVMIAGGSIRPSASNGPWYCGRDRRRCVSAGLCGRRPRLSPAPA
jgi:hypothetical protein